MPRFSRAAFLAISILALTALLYFQEQTEQQRQRYERLTQQVDNLQEVYENTLQELTEVHSENRELLRELDKALYQIETVNRRNNQLETILFNQRQTYQGAVGMRGASMPILTQSHFTAKQYERAWSKLGASGFKGTGKAFVLAEETYGVNSLVLSAIAFLESAGGKSKLARKKNNLFGLGAGGSTPYQNALRFSTKEECIFHTAKMLRYRYLSRGAQTYRGDNLSAIGPNYAADPQWAKKVSRAMCYIARAAIPRGT